MKFNLQNANPLVAIPDDLVLWRYLDFPKFLDLLTSNQLKMPRASKMEDGFEGMMDLGAIKGSLAKAKQRGEPSYLRHAAINIEQRQSFFWRDRTYVSCWNAFPGENAGLWRIYGDDKGLAIRTTWEALRHSFVGTADCVEDIHYGFVDYRASTTDPYFSNTYTDQYFVKRSEFVHEREFRLVAHDRSREHRYDQPSSDGLPQFASIDCDLERLIGELVVSPLLGRWVRDAAQSVSHQYGGQWPVTSSNLYRPPLNDINFF